MSLGKPKNETELAELTAALGDEDNNIRWLAVSALSRLGGLPVVRLLVVYLNTNPGQTASEEAVKVLKMIAETDEDEGVRTAAQQLVDATP